MTPYKSEISQGTIPATVNITITRLLSSHMLYCPHENTGGPVRKCRLSLGQQLHARPHQTAAMHSENALLLLNKRRGAARVLGAGLEEPDRGQESMHEGMSAGEPRDRERAETQDQGGQNGRGQLRRP
eukprot:1673835-Rhodomonas_salina.1